VAVCSAAAIMIASNNAAALAADAGVEEVGANSVDAGGSVARRSREDPGSSGAASEQAEELQLPKK
jgi:hypothetical protein